MFSLLISASDRNFYRPTRHFIQTHLFIVRKTRREALPRKTTHFSNSSYELVHLWFYWGMLYFNILSLGRFFRP